MVEDDTFTHVGTLPGELVRELSGGRIHDSIDVRINRLVVESDVTLIVGPVLPHEVIGFSGGNKYLFPGLSGQEMIDVTHWLGALITSSEIIGPGASRLCGRWSTPRPSSCPVNATRCAWWSTRQRRPGIAVVRGAPSRGPPRRTSRPRHTSSISTPGSGGCCR